MHDGSWIDPRMLALLLMTLGGGGVVWIAAVEEVLKIKQIGCGERISEVGEFKSSRASHKAGERTDNEGVVGNAGTHDRQAGGRTHTHTHTHDTMINPRIMQQKEGQTRGKRERKKKAPSQTK